MALNHLFKPHGLRPQGVTGLLDASHLPADLVNGYRLRVPVTTTYRVAAIADSGRPNVRLHVLRAERALGKPLPPGAVVHHADGSKGDDAPLVICENQGYHRFLHARMRVKAAGGNPNTEAICGLCRAVKPLEAFSISRRRSAGRSWACRACDNAEHKQRYDARRRKTSA